MDAVKKGVIVEWIDCMMYTDEQLSRNEIEPRLDILSVGILVEDAKETYTIALCEMEKDNYRQIMVIPKTAVKRIKFFNLTKPRRAKTSKENSK